MITYTVHLINNPNQAPIKADIVHLTNSPNKTTIKADGYVYQKEWFSFYKRVSRDNGTQEVARVRIDQVAAIVQEDD